MKIKFYINNSQVELPENVKEFEIELNYDKEVIQQQVSTNKWRWVRENATLVNKHILEGLMGGVGIFEGLPFRIDLEQQGATRTVFNGYIDLTEETDINCNDISVTAKEKLGIDWLNDVADSASFERIFENNEFTADEFKFVPYVINTVPNYREAIMTLVTGIMVGIQMKNEVKILTADIADCGNPWWVSQISKVVLDIVFLTLLLIVFIGLILSLILYIIQPVKFHAGMYLKDLFIIGCRHFNLTFKSSIFDNENWAKAIIIPEKFELEEAVDSVGVFEKLGGGTLKAGIKGFTSVNKTKQRGFYKGTFGEFLRTMKTIFNAKIILKDGILIFERKDYNLSVPKYILPDLRNDFYQLNTSEMKSNYLIEFSHDINDKNTIDKFKGNIYQIITEPIIEINKEFRLLKNLERVSIPFALAKRKEEFTVPEKIVSNIVKIINAPMQVMVSLVQGAISVLNDIIDTANDIIDALSYVGIDIDNDFPLIPEFKPDLLKDPSEDRIGMMLLENDYIDVPKILMIEENSNPRKTKLTTNNETFLTAKTLWENYHFINSFVEKEGKHNQYFIYEFENVPFCLREYEKVKFDNKIFDKDGITISELLSLKWNIWGQKANIRFKINKKYTNNLQLKFLEPDGN